VPYHTHSNRGELAEGCALPNCALSEGCQEIGITPYSYRTPPGTKLPSCPTEATHTARRIVDLREEARTEISQQLGRRSGTGLLLLESLFRHPIVNVKRVGDLTGLSQPAANALSNALEEIGILRETTGRKTYRMFAFERYLELFQEKDERT
jgi:hypothetical protein